MKKSLEKMQSMLEELHTIKNELTSREEIKESWIDGVEVQSQLHISEKTLYNHRRHGRLAYSRVRGKIYYKKSDIRELLEKNYRVEKPHCTCCSCTKKSKTSK